MARRTRQRPLVYVPRERPCSHCAGPGGFLGAYDRHGKAGLLCAACAPIKSADLDYTKDPT